MSKSDKGTTMLTNPIAYLSQIEDPRRQNKNLLHPLKNILTIALTGILCGYSDWVAIEDFASENQAWFASFLDLTNGIPSHDTFSNVMKRLNKPSLCSTCTKQKLKIGRYTAFPMLAMLISPSPHNLTVAILRFYHNPIFL